MFGISFFKLPQARSYNYKPVFYDPEKEEFEKRKQQTSQNIETERKISFRKDRKERKETTKSNIRLIAIIIALTFLAIYFLYS
ncbi:MAG: hypothetical protein HPY79_02400 [Bacteroidales bacterium]|nr:hypothetical protein [Bacteroidales bacterium]